MQISLEVKLPGRSTKNETPVKLLKKPIVLQIGLDMSAYPVCSVVYFWGDDDFNLEAVKRRMLLQNGVGKISAPAKTYKVLVVLKPE